MKTKLFLSVMAVFFTIAYAKADWHPVHHRINEAVQINMRGIDFYIFPNGDFDYKIHTSHPYHRYNSCALRIERDNKGRIRRIGKVFVNYNKYGQVKRIGHVFIRYNKRGMVSRIGERELHYRSRGYVVIYSQRPAYGYVASSYYYGPAQGYYAGTCETASLWEMNNAYGYHNDYYRSSSKENLWQNRRQNKAKIKGRRR